MTAKWICSVIALFPGSVQFPPSFSSLAYHTAMESWAGPENKLLGLLATQLQVTYLCVLVREVQWVWSSLEE